MRRDSRPAAVTCRAAPEGDEAPEAAPATGPEPRLPVHVVDDDPALRRTIEHVLTGSGYVVFSYDRAEPFLAGFGEDTRGVVILDVHLPDMDGLEVLAELRRRNSEAPVLILTGHADVPMTIKAWKRGAAEFLEKPFRASDLRLAVASAEQSLLERLVGRADRARAIERLGRLSPRELQTLEQLSLGLMHKVVAHNLGVSVRTVEEHRSRIMKKLEVRSLAEALRMLHVANS